jgi:hypothetical protein
MLVDLYGVIIIHKDLASIYLTRLKGSNGDGRECPSFKNNNDKG